MSGFKLIAIRPLEGCEKKYYKLLKPNFIYKFYQNYTFLDENSKEIIGDSNKEVFKVDYSPTLTKLFLLKEKKKPNVNISAIVGRNGSGKSAITELIFLSIYIIGIKCGYLPNINYYKKRIQTRTNEHNDFLKRRELNEEERKSSNENYQIDLKEFNHQIEQINFIIDNLKLELFYSIDENIFCLRIDKDNSALTLIQGDKKTKRNYHISLLLQESNEHLNEHLFINNFFYSIALNYSIYGLNSNLLGNWIETLFHKNDGYKTPLVINPMRTEGNFDINNESHLAQSRILANLIDDSLQVKKLVENKTVERIVFEVDESKLDEIFTVSLTNVIDKFLSQYKFSLEEAFEIVYKKILKLKPDEVKKSNYKEISHFKLIAKYVIKKLFKIAKNYDEYNKHLIFPKESTPIPELTKFEDYINDLSLDNSHKTLKLKQILNVVRFNLLKEEKDKNIFWNDRKLTLSIEELTIRIKKAKINSKRDLLEYIPVAFYNPQLIIANESNFQLMSSGEQQMVNVIHTIFYHIINLNSILNTNNSSKKEKYTNINVILDEVELYFHPDFQKKFINELLNGISRLNIPNIKNINFIFFTHSPFILSDIPSNNILRLKDGVPQLFKKNEQTLGANINDILANDFFLMNGFMGEYIKNRINSLIDYIEKGIRVTDEWDLAKAEEFIDAIGEPLIRIELKELFMSTFYDDKQIEEAIKRLQEIKKSK